MLAELGNEKIKWVANHMPIMQRIHADFMVKKPFEGYKIGVCLHIESKTGYLANVLVDGGAKLAICGSNPLSTKNDIVESLLERGIYVYARNGIDKFEYYQNIKKVTEFSPNLIIDDGADLVSYLHDMGKEKLKNIVGGTEETTTGITRLSKMKHLCFPMIAVNDTPMKCMFDNRFGTSQSTLSTFLNITNMSISGKTVVVCGYGWCGKGITSRARGLGAEVIVCEVDYVKANEALMDGYRVMKMEDASCIGDIFITVTGCINVIRKEHIYKMKNHAILLNSGHFNNEINISDLEEKAISIESKREHITSYKLDNGNEIYLLAEGRLLNLVAGEGHPIEIIDLSFSIQLLSLLHIVQNQNKLSSELLPVPSYIDEMVAKINLETRGIKIDKLSTAQMEYLNKTY